MDIIELYTSLGENINHIQKYNNPKKYVLAGIGVITLFCIGIVFLYSGAFILGGIFLLTIASIFLYHLLRYFIFFTFINKISVNNPIIFRSKVNDIELLLKQLQNIFSISQYLTTLAPPSLIHNNIPEIIIKHELEFILLRLAEIKMELSQQIEENVEKLYGSSEELGKIANQGHQTSIFSLQSARLDHQIKQFEKLQKVLVKI